MREPGASVKSLTMLTISDPIAVANGLRPALLHLNRRLRRELAPLGITGGQASLLWVIRSNPGIGVRELASREGVSPPALTAYVDRLEAAGLVVRRRSEDDRRRVELALTEEGLRVLRSARSRRTAWLVARLRRLEPDELGAVEAALPALRKLLEDDA
jgi:DNA-binding MarR family transcriptional regulator